MLQPPHPPVDTPNTVCDAPAPISLVDVASTHPCFSWTVSPNLAPQATGATITVCCSLAPVFPLLPLSCCSILNTCCGCCRHAPSRRPASAATLHSSMGWQQQHATPYDTCHTARPPPAPTIAGWLDSLAPCECGRACGGGRPAAVCRGWC
jgi:hypothetical protein